jgi:hypothetical protein
MREKTESVLPVIAAVRIIPLRRAIAATVERARRARLIRSG